MKSITLHDFILTYPKLIQSAVKKNEEIIITKRNIPYFKIVPLKVEVSYTPMSRENPPTLVKIGRKFKGRKSKTESFLIG
jgi:antitoxin (DNA-binding transcriptional repressor) of toxin-antitoxin stability system